MTPHPHFHDSKIPQHSDRGERDWRTRAACLAEDPELFFAIGTGPDALAQIEDAKAVCAGCPVVGTCLAWALDTRQDDGVWGATTGDERRALRRQQAKVRAARMVAQVETPALARATGEGDTAGGGA